MTEMTSYAQGTFSWVELGTTDLADAQRFYGGLFGWEPGEVATPEGVNYTLERLDGHDVVGMYQLLEQQSAQGIRPHWLSYVAVDDVDQTAERVSGLGGTVVAPPMDVMDMGRMAVVQDPSGAIFALWEARNHPGSGMVNEPGSLTWNELATRQAHDVAGFYCSLFDWTGEERQMGPLKYTSFLNGDQPVGGMLQMTEEWGQMPPNWMVYFAVADCDAAAARAAELGAAVPVPPTDLPGVGRFALIQDPQGAMFSIVTMENQG